MSHSRECTGENESHHGIRRRVGFAMAGCKRSSVCNWLLVVFKEIDDLILDLILLVLQGKRDSTVER